MDTSKKKRLQKRKIIIIILSLCVAVSGLLCIAEDIGLPFSWDSIFSSLKKSPDLISQEDNSIHFIDVGQGDCALLVSGENAALIDCGENGSGEKVTNYLESLGVDYLDFILLSHNDSDHIGGADEIIEEIPTKIIYADEIPQVKDNKNYKDVVSAALREGTQIISPSNLQNITLGDMRLEIYIPSPDDKTDENENGIVVLADVFGYETLFTGDIGTSTEKLLIKENPSLDCDILKVGHHGSKYSTHKDFLKTVTPDYAVISVGADNRYGHPTSDVLNRLSNADSKVYRTDVLGSVVFKFDHKGILAPAS